MTVHLVGAGPGDPELLTVKAVHLLEQADVVVYDRLVDPRILELAAPWAEMVDVGKRPGAPSDAQARINEILVDRGRRFDCAVDDRSSAPSRGRVRVRGTTYANGVVLRTAGESTRFGSGAAPA